MMATDNAKLYKTSLINNRRYLGNKYKLLPFITKVVNEECEKLNLLLIFLPVQVRFHQLSRIKLSPQTI